MFLSRCRWPLRCPSRQRTTAACPPVVPRFASTWHSRRGSCCPPTRGTAARTSRRIESTPSCSSRNPAWRWPCLAKKCPPRRLSWRQANSGQRCSVLSESSRRAQLFLLLDRFGSLQWLWMRGVCGRGARRLVSYVVRSEDNKKNVSRTRRVINVELFDWLKFGLTINWSFWSFDWLQLFYWYQVQQGICGTGICGTTYLVPLRMEIKKKRLGTKMSTKRLCSSHFRPRVEHRWWETGSCWVRQPPSSGTMMLPWVWRAVNQITRYGQIALSQHNCLTVTGVFGALKPSLYFKY